MIRFEKHGDIQQLLWLMPYSFQPPFFAGVLLRYLLLLHGMTYICTDMTKSPKDKKEAKAAQFLL